MRDTYIELKSLQCRPVASGDWGQHSQHLLNHTVQVAQAAQLLQADVCGAVAALPRRCRELGAGAGGAPGDSGLQHGTGLEGIFLHWGWGLALVLVNVIGHGVGKWFLSVPALDGQGVQAGSCRAALTLLVQLMGHQLLPYFFNH